MRLRSLFLDLALAWLFVDGAVAQAADPAMVDPFLQAAQLAEEVPTGDLEAESTGSIASEELVHCGDEVDLAGVIEPNYRCRGQWTVLTELTTLLPSFSTSTIATANEHPIIGPRLSLGWESVTGFGIRGRAWGFDSAVDMEQSYGPLQYGDYWGSYTLSISDHQMNFSGGKFDLDFYKRIELERGHFSFGASITAAELKLQETLTVTESFHYSGIYGYYMGYEPDVYSHHEESSIRNRGAGLGLLAEGSHRFYETPVHAWSAFGRGRIAYLIGEWESPYSGGLDEGDGNMAISEAALGLEYRRKLSRADLFAQCSFEVQSWDVTQVGRVNFAGVTTGIGLAW